MQVHGETKKDVEVHYINLGNLLSEHGEKIMETLMYSKYLPIMNLPFIQYFVSHQWEAIKWKIRWGMLVPFVVLLLLFTSFCIVADFHDEEEVEENTARKVGTWVNGVFVLICVAYFYFIEAQ